MFVFSPLSFLVRWVLSMFLVFSTYNPTGYSYYHWITAAADDHLPLKMFIGCLLAITYAVFGMTMWRAMGPFGIAAAVAWLTTVVWILVEYDLLSLESTHAMTTTVCTVFATLLSFGVSTSHFKVRLIGQTESNYVEYY